MTASYIKAVNQRLEVLLNECREDTLREAMAYSVLAGGKRLRPQLLLAACEAACGQYTSAALDFACAVEMIHTYSLIHDDLPAMDDDDYRRGRLTCHKVYGEALAILAGDALLSHALETMARVCLTSGFQGAVAAMLCITRAAGANGMVAGQVADMQWENKTADESALLYIHEHKTGALITACVEAGAMLGGAEADFTQNMARVGYLTGLAFQIRDDILDVTATTQELGKPAHSDEKNCKNTFVTVHGMDKALSEYRRLSNEALALLDQMPLKTDSLAKLLRRIMERAN